MQPKSAKVEEEDVQQQRAGQSSTAVQMQDQQREAS